MFNFNFADSIAAGMNSSLEDNRIAALFSIPEQRVKIASADCGCGSKEGEKCKCEKKEKGDCSMANDQDFDHDYGIDSNDLDSNLTEAQKEVVINIYYKETNPEKLSTAAQMYSNMGHPLAAKALTWKAEFVRRRNEKRASLAYELLVLADLLDSNGFAKTAQELTDAVEEMEDLGLDLPEDEEKISANEEDAVEKAIEDLGFDSEMLDELPELESLEGLGDEEIDLDLAAAEDSNAGWDDRMKKVMKEMRDSPVTDKHFPGLRDEASRLRKLYEDSPELFGDENEYDPESELETLAPPDAETTDFSTPPLEYRSLDKLLDLGYGEEPGPERFSETIAPPARRRREKELEEDMDVRAAFRQLDRWIQKNAYILGE